MPGWGENRGDIVPPPPDRYLTPIGCYATSSPMGGKDKELRKHLPKGRQDLPLHKGDIRKPSPLRGRSLRRRGMRWKKRNKLIRNAELYNPPVELHS